MLFKEQAEVSDGVPVRPADCKTHPTFEQVNKDETRLTMSSFCLEFRKTVASSNSVMDAAMLEEHSCAELCATAALPGDKAFSRCLFYVQLVSV